MIIPKKLTLFLIFFLTLSLLYSASVFSQGMEKERPFKSGLGLSAEQKEKIKSLALEGKKEEIRLKSDLRIAQLELRELMHQDALDKAKISRKIDELGALRTKLQKAKIEKRMALREVLTKEQLQALRERRLHQGLRKRIMEKRIRLKEGRPPRLQERRIGPLSEEMPLPPPQEEEAELSIAPEEPPLEPEMVIMEEELFPLFEEFEPLPPMEELPLLLEEEFPSEE